MRSLARLIVAALVVLSLAACNPVPPPSSSSCSISTGVALAVGDRADGVYGVVGETVGGAPLVRFDQMVRTDEGVDAASGKPWFRFRLLGDSSRALQTFTAARENRSILVVVGGEVAAHHKIREPFEGPDLQVSCCNPAACHRWMSRVHANIP